MTSLTYDFLGPRLGTEPVTRSVFLELQPATVRCFTTDRTSSASPGDLLLLIGLFGLLRQTTNTLDWQDDDLVRATLPTQTLLLSPNLTINKEAARENLFEVRALTGFTWDELATLLGVDRRTLHNWTQGGPVRGGKQERLAELLRVLRSANRGSPQANRLVLYRPNATSGLTAMALLTNGRYDDALALLGRGDTHRVSVPDRDEAE